VNIKNIFAKYGNISPKIKIETMKIRTDIAIATLIGLSAICMNCNPSKKAVENTNISTDTVASVNPPLLETHWTLVELMGKPIKDTPVMKEMYIVFKKAEARVEGNGGCNSFSGTYTLPKENEISFSPLVSTKMYCKGINYEDEFFKALSTADHYYLKADKLSLTEGEILRVAKFIAKD
jgi:heat shock protein HslJ